VNRFFPKLLLSALSACWLFCSQQATAQGFIIDTVLTNPTPDGFFGPDGIPVYSAGGGAHSVVSIDLNHDGLEDYRVVATGTISEGFQMEGSSLNAVWSHPTGGFDIGALIVPLSFGTEIGSNLPVGDEWTLTYPGTFGLIAPGFSSYSSAGFIGLFVNQTAYAGLQFYIGADVYYGWIKVQEIPALAGGGIVYEYAYDTRPNTAITAGEVPEPSTWALLAAGATFLFCRRKIIS
jgi:hypothetical protein